MCKCGYNNGEITSLCAAHAQFYRVHGQAPCLTRAQVVKFIDRQINHPAPKTIGKHGKQHYGKQELKQLLDAIYGAPPKCPAEELSDDFDGKPFTGYDQP